MGNKKKRFSQYDEIHEDFCTQSFKGDMLVPSNFRMLCILFETSPEKILSDFMWTLSCMPTDAKEEQRKASLEYFLLSGYGQQAYSEEDIRQIFRELEANRCLSPQVDDNVITQEQWKLHYCWRNMYMQYWFEKWYQKAKPRREKQPMRKY